MADRNYRAGLARLLTVFVMYGAHAEAAAREADSGEDQVAAETRFTGDSRFEVIDLGALPGNNHSIGLAINNSGWVVGESTTAVEIHAFLWRPGIGLTRIEGPTRSISTFAMDVNDLGVVLAGSDAPFLWWLGRAFSLKGQLDGASALNNRLDVAGSLNATAAVWRRGQLTVIGGLGGQFSAARAINDDEVVAGVSDTPTAGERHPFIWHGGGIHDLGTLPGKPMCEVSDISNTNIVVGFCSSPSATQSFRFRDGELKPLPQPPTEAGALALSVNNQGFVVGADSSASRAVGWTPNGTLVDLNGLLPADSGWILFHAHGINNRLEIVGMGQTPSGQNHAFLLRPR